MRFTTEPAVERLYGLVANEEDARVCTDISDEACREVPGNFFLMLSSLVLTKIGDLLINPKTVLAWLIGAVGAPPALVAWLVPIRESGSLIPQLIIAAQIRRQPHRKPVWVIGSTLQGLCVLAMGISVYLLEGTAAGLAVVGLLIAWSLSRGLCSVAMKDVQGKCIPKTRRGRLAGLASTFSGVATLVITMLAFSTNRDPSLPFYTGLLFGAGLLWMGAALLFSRIDEFAGETAGGGNALNDAIRSLSLLKWDKPFRDFVMTRGLLMASALGAPFLVVLTQDGGGWMLGSFVLASALASMLSAGIWGWMADVSSRLVMVRAGALAALVCLTGACLALAAEGDKTLGWIYPGLFFVLAVAHDGVRIGRKTYLVDMAGGNKRTDYVAVSNTVIGVLLLVVGGLSALASSISPAVALLLLAAMGLTGAVSAVRLPTV
ncbi:MAG: MFS transporter [Pseudomonadota bacterium]|nr:MFS transporter [Pseudomonadota bacterium]